MKVFDKNRFGLKAFLGTGCMGLWLLLLPALPVRAQDEKECLDCHPKYFEELSGDFNHKPFDQGDCYACHRFHGFRNDVELIGPADEVCTFCHENILEPNEESIHFPLLDDGSCLNCHLPHSGTSKGLLVSPQQQICIECHDAPDEKSAYIHPPYNDTTCVECHNPHGSSFGRFFYMPIEFMCLGCHADFPSDIEPSEIHPADQGQTCDKCHYGHNSSFKALLRMEPGRLCLDCHDTLRKELESSSKHTILEDGDCLVCHKPHFQKTGVHLIAPQRELCLTCHDEIEKKGAAKIVHAPAEDDCTVCHDPHIRLDRKKESGLCEECHDYSDKGFKSAHLELTPKACTECHDPHGSEEKGLIRETGHPPFVERECEICHRRETVADGLRNIGLCLDCHDAGEGDDSHGDLDFSGKSCVTCHSPHSSLKKGLYISDNK